MSTNCSMKHNTVTIATLYFSLTGMLFSYWAELVVELQPCRLCLVQRYLLLAVALTTILRAVWAQRTSLLALEIFTVSCLLAASSYHLAIQYNWLAPPCLNEVSTVSIKSFLDSLPQSIPCSQSMLTVMGVPAPLASIVIFGSILVHQVRFLATRYYKH